MPTPWPFHQPPTARKQSREQINEQIADCGRLGLYALFTAVTIWFLMQLPQLAAAQVRSETARVAAADRQIRDICQARGLGPQSHEFTLCTIDLQAQRQRLGTLAASSIMSY